MEDFSNIINWDAVLSSTEPDIAWSRFKTTIFHYVDKHIPTITVKNEYKPPWFDSELHDACKAAYDFLCHTGVRGPETPPLPLGFDSLPRSPCRAGAVDWMLVSQRWCQQNYYKTRRESHSYYK